MPALRRLLRILLNTATAVSLALCVVTVALWVRSQTVAEVIAYGDLLEHRNAGEIKYRERSIVAFRDAVAFRETIWTQNATPQPGVAENDRVDALERGRIMQAAGG